MPFEQDLLGQTVRYGWARITYEHLAVNLIPPPPNGQAGMRIEARGEMELRLVEQPLPSDFAVDPKAGRWSSAVVE